MQKWLISESVSSVNMYVLVIKRLELNYDTPRQYLNFFWTDFWYPTSFGITWLSNSGFSTFSKQILPLTRSQLAVLYMAYFRCLCSVMVLRFILDTGFVRYV